jgi:hypothetical protein
MQFTDRRILFYGFATTNFFFREVVRKLQDVGHKPSNLGVVFPNGQYRKFYNGILPDDNTCYLYRNYNAVYAEVQRDRNYTVIRQDFIDNAFMILAADKGGFRYLPSGDQLDNLETIFRIYSEFLDRFRPDYIVFPDIEVVDGYLLYNMAKARNIPIAYYFHLRNLGQGVLGDSITEDFPPYFGAVTDRGGELAERFMREAKESLPPPSSFNPPWTDDSPISIGRENPALRLIQSFILSLGVQRHYHGEDNYTQKLKIAILPFLNKYRDFMYEKFVRPAMHIRGVADIPDKFHLFALQVTPESSINYLMPYYVDQIRAIDEIRMALPPDTWLVVKEHPSMKGARPASFYRDLKKMPGVLLADALVPMVEFRSRAEVIFTITGTVALECLFTKTPCYMFGRNFVERYVPGKRNNPDIKAFLRQNLQQVMNEKYDKFIADLPKIYSVSYPTIVSEPRGVPTVMATANIAAFIAALEDHFGRIEGLRLAA